MMLERSEVFPEMYIIQALEKSDTYPSSVEARCSSMVKAFAHGAMGRRIDRS